MPKLSAKLARSFSKDEVKIFEVLSKNFESAFVVPKGLSKEDKQAISYNHAIEVIWYLRTIIKPNQRLEVVAKTLKGKLFPKLALKEKE